MTDIAETFERIPSSVLRRNDLSPAAKLVYAFMRPLVAKHMPVGQRLIADQCGMSKTMALRAVREVVDAGLLVRHDAKNGCRSRYSLPENRSTDGPLERDGPVHGRTAAGPQVNRSPVHGRTGSGPSTDHDQTPDLPDRPDEAPLSYPDPLGQLPSVSPGQLPTRLWVLAMRDLSPKPFDETLLSGRDRERLRDLAAWARSTADVAERGGGTWTETYAEALHKSLLAFVDEAKSRIGVPLNPGGWWARREAWRAAA